MVSHQVKTRTKYRNYGPWLVSLSYCVIIAIVLWSSYLRYRDFSVYHQAMASSTVSELVHGIERIVVERQRLVELFAEQHIDLIQRSAEQPDDDDRRAALQHAIARFFPTFFAFTLTRPDGTPLLEDYDGYVGDQCLVDVHEYVDTHINAVRVHPNAFVYHYDVMAHWGDHAGILLISFPADEISALMRSSQAPGHVLSIIQPKVNNLIEITAEGARNVMPREDYRMSTDELARVLVSKNVGNTRWALIDSYDQNFATRFQREVVLEASTLIVLLGILTVVTWFILNRNEKIRRRSELLKDEFVSVVSHELRTPLTSIQGSLSLLQGGVCGEVTDKSRELFQIALNNTDRLRMLVDDLLDIRKIESGKLELDLCEVDIMEIVEKAIEQNQGYAMRFDVRFVLREATNAVFVNADPLRIGQVLGNLLSNAAKFSRPGGIVEISVRRGGPGEVEVAVRDHGAGIDPVFQPHVFDKFAQGDSSSTRHSSGTGLGLAIVKALVEAHQGHVGFDSQQGVGSTFYFRLAIKHTDRA